MEVMTYEIYLPRRLVEELVLAYKGSSKRKSGSDIRTSVVQVLGVLQL
jgi:hypothetical protein